MFHSSKSTQLVRIPNNNRKSFTLDCQSSLRSTRGPQKLDGTRGGSLRALMGDLAIIVIREIASVR